MFANLIALRTMAEQDRAYENQRGKEIREIVDSPPGHHTQLPTWQEARKAKLREISIKTGKAISELVAWVDYDPITIDEDAYNMSRGRYGNKYWTGD